MTRGLSWILAGAAVLLVACGGPEQGAWPAAGELASSQAPDVIGECNAAELDACQAEHARWPLYQEAVVMGVALQVPRCDPPSCTVLSGPPAESGINVDGAWIRCQVRYRLWCGTASTAP